jgi:hypothetical protein
MSSTHVAYIVRCSSVTGLLLLPVLLDGWGTRDGEEELGKRPEVAYGSGDRVEDRVENHRNEIM